MGSPGIAPCHNQGISAGGKVQFQQRSAAKCVLKFLILTISSHVSIEETEVLGNFLPKVKQCICGNLDLSLELLAPSPGSTPPEHPASPFRYWNFSRKCGLQDFVTKMWSEHFRGHDLLSGNLTMCDNESGVILCSSGVGVQ